MTSERMSGPDAAWLHMDRPENLMIVNTILWFDATPEWPEVEATVQQRLVDRHRRFRQRVVDPPITLGLLAPSWTDTSATAVDHIVRTTLPAPGGALELHAYVARQAVLPLDPGRPLWQLHLIDGLGAGAALLLRTHHALADGGGLMEVLQGLTDPFDGRRPPDPSRPSSPHRPDEIAGEVVAHAQALAKLTARVVRVATRGRAHLSGVKTMAQSNPISLAALKDAGRGTDSTVNDVVLAAVAGALRSLTPSDETCVDLDVVVPMDLRPPDAPVGDALGNQFGLAFARLPVSSADPAERLRLVTDGMRRIKNSRESAVVLGSLGVMGRIPAAAQRAWSDAFVGDAVAVVTNVKGPAGPVALAGTPVAGMSLWVPSTGPLGVGISVVSYSGTVVVGVVVDDEVVSDGAALARAIDEELARLAEPARPG